MSTRLCHVGNSTKRQLNQAGHCVQKSTQSISVSFINILLYDFYFDKKKIGNKLMMYLKERQIIRKRIYLSVLIYLYL